MNLSEVASWPRVTKSKPLTRGWRIVAGGEVEAGPEIPAQNFGRKKFERRICL
jgi:hypothetical protein